MEKETNYQTFINGITVSSDHNNLISSPRDLDPKENLLMSKKII
jgi:hypothetical protein